MVRELRGDIRGQAAGDRPKEVINEGNQVEAAALALVLKDNLYCKLTFGHNFLTGRVMCTAHW